MKEWSESDLRIGCRLLPGRDDDILEFFSQVGKSEKSYKIREALRTFVKIEKGELQPTSTLSNLVVRERYLPPKGDTDRMIAVANNIQVSNPVMLNNTGEEPSDEDVLSALQNFSNL